jgi:hypothetical protein
MKTNKAVTVVAIHKDKPIRRLDVDGKWPTGTWLQQRRAMIKLTEARKELNHE